MSQSHEIDEVAAIRDLSTETYDEQCDLLIQRAASLEKESQRLHWEAVALRDFVERRKVFLLRMSTCGNPHTRDMNVVVAIQRLKRERFQFSRVVKIEEPRKVWTYRDIGITTRGELIYLNCGFGQIPAQLVANTSSLPIRTLSTASHLMKEYSELL